MKRVALSFLFALCLAASAGLAAREAQSLDRIRLKDGRTVSGRIVEERASSVVMLVRGVRRTYERAFVVRVTYGDLADGPSPEGADAVGAPGPESSDAPDGGAIPAVPPRPAGGLVAALALRYRVPVRDVLWVRAQGVDDARLPLVFLIAATARVTPRRVLELYRKGWTWAEIEDYFRMRPDAIVYEPGPWVPYPYYDLDDGWDYGVDLGWNGVWGGYGYGWAGRGGWDRGWGGGRGNGGGHGSWSGASGGGRIPVGAGRAAGGGSWSGAGRASSGGTGRASAGGGHR